LNPPKGIWGQSDGSMDVSVAPGVVTVSRRSGDGEPEDTQLAVVATSTVITTVMSLLI
jgi:hypothetical protein